MKYDPEIHHTRSSHIKGYDYSQASLYFITVACANMQQRFGSIVAEKMQLNACGLIASDQWQALSQRFENCELHSFIIMPNHVHGIIRLSDVSLNGNEQSTFAPVEATSAAGIIASYKSFVSAVCLPIYKSRDEVMGKLWQRDYEQQIIKDDKSFVNLSNNISNNPSRWKSDKYYI